MSTLAIAAEALTDYLQNVVDGRTIRDIARAQGCEPSTVLRRIRRCEELRDHPEWEAVLTALEQARAAADVPPRDPVARQTVLAALHLTAGQMASEFAARMHILSHPDGVLLAGDVPQAAVMAGGELKGNIRRDVALAALAFGWIRPVGPATGKVRRFAATEAAIESVRHDPAREVAAEPPRPAPRRVARYTAAPSPLEALLRRRQDLITPEHLRLAREFEMIYCARETATADAWCAVVAALAPRLLTALEEVCGKGTGFETLERKMCLPARSGKVVVAVALEAFAHAGAAA